MSKKIIIIQTAAAIAAITSGFNPGKKEDLILWHQKKKTNGFKMNEE